VSLAGPMLFDPRAFWGDEDVKILSYAQVGIYLRLLSHQWEEGSVPSDERRLGSVLTSATTQDEVDEVLTLFFEDSDGDGRLRNPRTAEDRAAWIAKKAKAKKDGRKGGKAKARGSVESPSRDPRPTLDQRQRDPKGSVESPSTISPSSSSPLPSPDLGVEDDSACASDDARTSKAERDFLDWWEYYPKKKGKPEALARWCRLKAKDRDLNEVLAFLKVATYSRDWTRDGGQYIPYGSTFVSSKLWQDGLEAYAADNGGSDKHGRGTVEPGDTWASHNVTPDGPVEDWPYED